jgi:hypothetical protein
MTTSAFCTTHFGTNGNCLARRAARNSLSNWKSINMRRLQTTATDDAKRQFAAPVEAYGGQIAARTLPQQSRDLLEATS